MTIVAERFLQRCRRPHVNAHTITAADETGSVDAQVHSIDVYSLKSPRGLHSARRKLAVAADQGDHSVGAGSRPMWCRGWYSIVLRLNSASPL